LAAKKVIAVFEVKPYKERAEDLVDALISAGIQLSIDNEVMVSRFDALLQSKEFNRNMENIYIEYLTANELNEIALMLQNKSLKKFLASRTKIFSKSQEVMSKYLEKVLSELP
jgi:replicative superfamily II helicase